MNKACKIIMELVFIFILPLLFILLGIKITNNYVYDENGNFSTSDKIIIYEPISYFDEYRNVIENFNIWNENWATGTISTSTGLDIENNNALRSVDYIPVESGVRYYFYCPSYVNAYWYDENYTYMSYTSWGNNQTNTIPNGVSYMRFASSSYGPTYNNNITINISVSWANGNYVPYGESLIIVSDTNLSGNATIEKSPITKIKEIVLNVFQLNNDNVVINIIFDYSCLWIIMFLIWHLLYKLLYWLFHIIKIKGFGDD